MADSGKTTPLGASGTGSCRSVLSCSSVRRDQDTEQNWKDGREWVAGVPQQVRGRRGCASVGAQCRRRGRPPPGLLEKAALGPGAKPPGRHPAGSSWNSSQALPGAPTAGGDGPSPEQTGGHGVDIDCWGPLRPARLFPAGPRAGTTGGVRKGNSRARKLLTSSRPSKKRLRFPP